MPLAKSVLVLAITIVGLQEIHAHGKLTDPVNRSSAWRKGFNTPPNYNDNENFCGGFGVQQANGGKCGPCGDNYRDAQPRDNENGGLYGTGAIVQTYKKGQRVTLTVDLSVNHLGHFEFSICPLKGPQDIETEECFEKHPVKLANGRYKYPILDSRSGDYKIDVVLPENLTCQRCTIRWHYRAGNSWGMCDNGDGQLGCGPQEQFRSCSDIAIV